MGGLNVKNTIVERLLGIVAPHPCFGCGKIGTSLCDNCKYDITYEPFGGCVLCGRPQKRGICETHQAPFERAFVAGSRTDTLKTTVNALKFHHTKQAALELARLLHLSLPLLPADTRLVPVPTAPGHVRQRGYDQVLLIARHLSALRGYTLTQLLQRTDDATQHLLGRKERASRAQSAYALKPEAVVAKGAVYLLLDDIITTGATLQGAAQPIAAAGGRVWAAALAYQPLD